MLYVGRPAASWYSKSHKPSPGFAATRLIQGYPSCLNTMMSPIAGQCVLSWRRSSRSGWPGFRAGSIDAPTTTPIRNGHHQASPIAAAPIDSHSSRLPMRRVGSLLTCLPASKPRIPPMLRTCASPLVDSVNPQYSDDESARNVASIYVHTRLSGRTRSWFG